SRPVITMDISVLLPTSIDITAPQCHDGLQQVNCLNVTTCFSFKGRHVPGAIAGMYSAIQEAVGKLQLSHIRKVYLEEEYHEIVLAALSYPFAKQVKATHKPFLNMKRQVFFFLRLVFRAY
ncbi:hypothetical protein JRQ81_018922, partial [Phrynocephalus forsythii]